MQLHFSKVNDALVRLADQVVRSAKCRADVVHDSMHSFKHWVLFGEDRGHVALLKQRIKSFYESEFSANVVYQAYSKASQDIDQIALLLKSHGLFHSSTLVVVEDYPDACTKEWEKLWLDCTLGGSLLIIADSLKRCNRMRKIAEPTQHIAVVNCYEQNKQEIAAYAKRYFIDSDIQCEDMVTELIASFLPSDMMLVASELEKLRSYAYGGNPVDIASVSKLLWDASELELNELCAALILGDNSRMLCCLGRISYHNISFMLILRVLQNYLVRLISIKNKYMRDRHSTAGITYSMQDMLNNTNPPFFGEAKRDAITILQTVDISSMRRLLFATVSTELECKMGVMKDVEMLLSKFLLCRTGHS